VSGYRDRFSTRVSADVQARAGATVRGVSFVTRIDYTLAQLTEEALAAYCKGSLGCLQERLRDDGQEGLLRPEPHQRDRYG
jgi:hypothetical protein